MSPNHPLLSLPRIDDTAEPMGVPSSFLYILESKMPYVLLHKYLMVPTISSNANLQWLCILWNRLSRPCGTKSIGMFVNKEVTSNEMMEWFLGIFLPLIFLQCSKVFLMYFKSNYWINNSVTWISPGYLHSYTLCQDFI